MNTTPEPISPELEEAAKAGEEAARLFAGICVFAARNRVILPVTYLRPLITSHHPGKPLGANGSEPQDGWLRVKLASELVAAAVGDIDEAPLVPMLVMVPQEIRQQLLNPKRIITPGGTSPGGIIAPA